MVKSNILKARMLSIHVIQRSFSFVPFNSYLGTMEEIGLRHQKPNMIQSSPLQMFCATFLIALCIWNSFNIWPNFILKTHEKNIFFTYFSVFFASKLSYSYSLKLAHPDSLVWVYNQNKQSHLCGSTYMKTS